MTPENFCYWLQGYFEIAQPQTLSSEHIQQIKDHLTQVFNKQTPVYNHSTNKLIRNNDRIC